MHATASLYITLPCLCSSLPVIEYKPLLELQWPQYLLAMRFVRQCTSAIFTRLRYSVVFTLCFISFPLPLLKDLMAASVLFDQIIFFLVQLVVCWHVVPQAPGRGLAHAGEEQCLFTATAACIAPHNKHKNNHIMSTCLRVCGHF